MVDETEWEKLDGAVKWAVVTVGGNDVDNTERVWVEQGWKVTEGGRLDRIIKEKLELWGKLLSKIKSHVDQVVVWLPGIRQHGTVVWWNTWMGKMERIALEKGATVRWVTKRIEGGFGFDAYWAKMKNRGGGGAPRRGTLPRGVCTRDAL